MYQVFAFWLRSFTLYIHVLVVEIVIMNGSTSEKIQLLINPTDLIVQVTKGKNWKVFKVTPPFKVTPVYGSYKNVYLGIWFPWPEVRSIFWPGHYKEMGKCLNASYSESMRDIMLVISRCLVSNHPRWPIYRFDPMTSPSGNSRSHEVKCFFAITFERIEIEQ